MALLAQPSDDLTGSLLRPGLRVDEVLGRGSFGTVYCGRQLAVDREVAVKVLHSWYAPDTEAGRLFRDEIRAIGRLDHHHVVRIFDADVTADGRLYFVMERLRGPTLQELAASGPLPVPRAVALVTQLLEGLAAVHAAGHIHADVKPSNVMVAATAASERAVLIDFGLSRLRQPGQEAVGGTRAFMAPEQLRSWQLEARSDVYSAALVLLMLLTGWQRGEAEDASPPPLEAVDDPALRIALTRALAVEPAQRPSAADFARALGGGAAEEPGPSGPPPPFRQLAPFTERDRGRLHGRRADVVRLARNLGPERATVLTAASGTGKTSLLRAGLLPFLDAQSVDHAYLACTGAAPDLSAAISAAIAAWQARSPRRLVLILDQAEALLTDPTGAANVLANVLEVGPLLPGAELAVLLAVREDFVARLIAVSPLLARGVPQVRLAPLDREGARAALVEPLAEHGLSLAAELLELLLEDLQRAGLTHGADLGWRDEAAVYPPHLQLAGTALVAALAAGETELTLAHYHRLGGFEAIVGDALDRMLGELSVGDRAVARELFLALVGLAQLRAVRSDEELRVRVGSRHGDAAVARVLDGLERQRLLARRISADGVPTWELVHDSLVPRIERWLTVQDLDRQRAAEILRFHLRESTAAAPSLLGAQQLRAVGRFAGLVDELEEEWQRRSRAEWTPRRLIARSRLVLQYRRGVAAAVGTLVLGLAALLAITWLGDRAARQGEALLRDRDLGRFELVLRPFDWRQTPEGLVAVDVDAAALPQLTWMLHEPDDLDPTAPGASVEAARFHHGRAVVEAGALLERGIEARGGDAVLVISGRGRDGVPCPPSSVPIRRLPGYASRARAPRRIVLPIPTCQASRHDTIEIPAGPFIAGGLGEPPPKGYTAADFPREDPHRELAAFRIDRTEISNAAFAVFARLAPITGIAVAEYPPQLASSAAPTSPRTDINAFDAEAYCRFLGKQLPSSDQWQKAMRGGLTLADGSINPAPRRNLPWGTSSTPSLAHLSDAGVQHPMPVGFSAGDVSPYGVLDLAGNVQEWTSSAAPSAGDSSTLAQLQRPRIVRGASWFLATSADLVVYMATENPRSPRQLNYFQGTRCVEAP